MMLIPDTCLSSALWLTIAGKTKNKQAAAEDEKTPRSTCTPAAACRKGWIWAVLVAGILMGVRLQGLGLFSCLMQLAHHGVCVSLRGGRATEQPWCGLLEHQLIRQ